MTEQEVRRYLRKMSEQDSQSAFREFYDMTYDRLFRIAYYYTHHEEWSQEIVLDVFMKLWEHRKQLLDIANIEDYCFILVKNASLNYIEKEERRPTLSAEVLQEPATDVSPEDTLISEELFARYVKALDRLPERCREVFILIREEKQTYAQVAEKLDISTKTVDAQLQKATEQAKRDVIEIVHCTGYPPSECSSTAINDRFYRYMYSYSWYFTSCWLLLLPNKSEFI